MNIGYFKDKIKELTYPENHDFDPETLEPIGILKKRIELLKKNVPELFFRNHSLLDIGSNKGFISFYLRDYYEKIVGYEPDKEMYNFSEELRKYHNIDNIEFVNNGFNHIPSTESFDVVYLGNVHHYLYRDDFNANRPPFSFIEKVKSIVDKYLIIDGVFENTSFTISKMSKDERWTKEMIDTYTLENHKKALLPQFDFIRIDYNGIGEKDSSRYTILFKK